MEPIQTPVAAPTAAVILIERSRIVPLRVAGPDRLDFVHGQLSNDVRGLAQGGWNRSLQLNHKGHVLASAAVFRRADDLYLAAEAGGDELLASLRSHVIFDQVEIEDLRDMLEVRTLFGPGLPALLDELGIVTPAAGCFGQVDIAGAAVLLHAAPWSRSGAVDLHLLRRDGERVTAALRAGGAAQGPAELFDLARIEAGVATAADAGEGVLPQEIALDGAVFYRKGCYLGQEIMARIEARAALRRGPARVVLALDPGPERDIVAAGRTVGRLGVVARHPDGRLLALAALRRDLVPDAEPSVAGVPLLAVEILR